MSTPTQSSRIRSYEAVILMHPDATLEEQKELFKKNKSIVEQMGKGSVYSVETWGKRILANKISKHHRAYYFHSLFEADTQTITELERTMKINDRVLRYMHTRLDERIALQKHMENFKKGLADSNNKEREREAKRESRRAAMAAAREGGGGGREGFREGFRDGGKEGGRGEGRSEGREGRDNKGERFE